MVELVVELEATVYPQKYALEQTFGILHYLETSSNSINTLAKALSGHGQAPLSELNMQDTLLSVLEDMTGKGEV